ncbi:hypothetical protein EBT31_12550 [bacterium]|nr:hypothetical protein [bacterium]
MGGSAVSGSVRAEASALSHADDAAAAAAKKPGFVQQHPLLTGALAGAGTAALINPSIFGFLGNRVSQSASNLGQGLAGPFLPCSIACSASTCCALMVVLMMFMMPPR